MIDDFEEEIQQVSSLEETFQVKEMDPFQVKFKCSHISKQSLTHLFFSQITMLPFTNNDRDGPTQCEEKCKKSCPKSGLVHMLQQ